MTGWPDPSRPGVPLNPERDGWHWVCTAISAPYPMLWSADGRAWDTGDGWEFCTSPRMTERARYLGPCHTPAEAAALVEAAGREGMREAAAIARKHTKAAGQRNTKDQWREAIGIEIAAAIEKEGGQP